MSAGDSISLERLELYLIEKILGESYALQFSQGDLPRSLLEPFLPPLKELSEEYTERGRTYAPELSLVKARAYALYYTPLNFYKIRHLLSELRLDEEKRWSHVLDFGCGPGTGSFALLPFLGSTTTLHAVDRSSYMREAAEMLLTPLVKERGAQLSVSSTIDSNVRYSLILAANVINEMEEDKAFGLLRDLAQLLTDDGILLVIDPALKAPTQRAMSLRDRLRSCDGSLTLLYPCTRQDSCPMRVVDPEGWCHGTLRWERPRLVAQLDELLGFNKHRIKYSAFAFGRADRSFEGYRVITPSERRPRGIEATLCGEKLYGPVILPKKEKSEQNRPFAHLEQHERVQVIPAPLDKLLRRDTVVRRTKKDAEDAD